MEREERRTRREKRRRDAKRRKMTMEEIRTMAVDVASNATRCRRLSTRPAAPTPTRLSAAPPTRLSAAPPIRQFVTRFPRPQSRTSAPSSTSRIQASPSALTRSERCAVLSLDTNKSATRITANRAAASPLVPPKWWRAVLQSNRLLTDRSATRVHRRCATRSHRRCATRSHQRPVASNQLLSTSKSQEGCATKELYNPDFLFYSNPHDQKDRFFLFCSQLVFVKVK